VEDAVAEVCRKKAQAVARNHPDRLIVAADTIVVVDGRVLGKPADEDDAAAMLRALSGRSHTVYTGVTVIRGDRVLSHAERTEVRFRSLSEREIEAYIATKEPMDKAGAYGAQGYASLFVEALDGDFFNVMGLPVCRLEQMLRQIAPEYMEEFQ